MKKELVFTELDREFCQGGQISSVLSVKKWCSVPYETKNYSGNMLVSLSDSNPEDVVFSPGVRGWYKIFVAIPVIYAESIANIVQMKLSSDPAFVSIIPSKIPDWDEFVIEESLWRCADMTDESIILTKKFIAERCNSMLSWIRMVPMSDEEVEKYKQENANPDNKRLYFSHDVHMFLYMSNAGCADDFKSIIQPLKDTDFAYAAVECMSNYDGECLCDESEASFAREGDRRIQYQTKKLYNDDTIKGLVDYGHELGLKMVASHRLGAWGQSFPFVQNYFSNRFSIENPQLHCVDRDGKRMRALSYAYPEVRKYIIDHMIGMARLGFDAVSPIFTRRVPLLLFEEPVVKRFYEKYGEYPYELPLADKRLNALHCEILTEFMQELRDALDTAIPDRRIEIHARIPFSVPDSYTWALDIFRWAKEGLVDCILSYPQRLYEKLPQYIFKDSHRLDLDKYSEYLDNSAESTVFFDCDFDFLPPYTDCYGNSAGPNNQAERINELMSIESEYGVKLFFDMMPREMSPEENEKRAREMYSLGAERICMWDTNERCDRPAKWSTVKRLGHKKEICNGEPLAPNTFSYHRILSVAGLSETKF